MRNSLLKRTALAVLLCAAGLGLAGKNLFAQQQGQTTIDAALEMAVRSMRERLEQGTRLAVLNFSSDSGSFSHYAVEELASILVQAGRFTMIDRQSTEVIREEMAIQLSGDVSDDSAQAIGKQLGAEAVITGSLTSLANGYRMWLKVIEVETLRIPVYYRCTIQNDANMAHLMGGQRAAAPSAQPVVQPAGTPAAAAPAQQAALVAAAAPAVRQSPPVAAVQPAAVNGQTEGDYKTRGNADGTVTITKYDGWDKDITIPGTIGGKRVTAIGDRAFQKMDLSSVVIPDSVTSIENNAFSDNQLTSVTIGNSVTTIGGSAFSSNQLTSVTIPDSVTSIGSEAFRSNQLISVIIGSSVTTIWNRAFESNQLTTVIIPNSVTYIKSSAFSDNQLTSVTFAEKCVYDDYSSFGKKVFYEYKCNDRKAGTYTIASDDWVERNTKEADNFRYVETEYGLAILAYTGDSNRVAVPEQINGKPVKYIGWLKSGITGVRIPNTVTAIGREAFSREGLISIEIPNSVTFIGKGAFYSNQLTSVTIPDSVTFIGESAFYSNQLTSVTIPDSVTSIGYAAFQRNRLTSVTIGTGVITIGYEAFESNQLTSVTIPNSVTTIGNRVFLGNGLNRVTIGANVAMGDSFDSFDSYDNSSLKNAYDSGGKQAGTYVRGDTGRRSYNHVVMGWSKQ
jgi:TolB-like protein